MLFVSTCTCTTQTGTVLNYGAWYFKKCAQDKHEWLGLMCILTNVEVLKHTGMSNLKLKVAGCSYYL